MRWTEATSTSVVPRRGRSEAQAKPADVPGLREGLPPSDGAVPLRLGGVQGEGGAVRVQGAAGSTRHAFEEAMTAPKWMVYRAALSPAMEGCTCPPKKRGRYPYCTKEWIRCNGRLKVRQKQRKRGAK